MIPYVEIPNTCWDAVSKVLMERWTQDKADRLQHEQIWLRDKRQYRGILDPEDEKVILERGWGSRAFIRTTRIKVRSNDAKINDIAFNPKRQNWALQPRQRPDLAIQVPDANADDAGKVAIEAMQKVMQDHLSEADYNRLGRLVTHAGHESGTGILKGPLPILDVESAWVPDGNGGWTVKETERLRIYIEYVPIWDFYPDMSARCMAEIDHSFQRHPMSFPEVMALADREDMDGALIREHVSGKPQGDYVRLDWEQEVITQDTKNEKKLPQQTRRYEVLEFWGVIDTRVLVDALEAANVALPEHWTQLSGAIEITAWLFASTCKIFKCCVNPFNKQWRPYSFYTPDPDDALPFGNSIPSITRDTTLLKNATLRSAMDNVAASAGWQAEVDKDRLEDADSLDNLSPFQVHFTKSESWNAARPAINFYQPQMNVAGYINMLAVLDRYDDEASGTPSYQYGQSAQGAGRTARGLGMLMGKSDLLMLEQNNACDDFQRDFLAKCFDWEMQFNEDDAIKGDFHVFVTPSDAESDRDELSQKLEQFAVTTGNPLDAPWVHRRRLLKKRAEAMGVHWEDVLKTDQELKDETDAMNNGAPPAQPAAADTGAGAPPAGGAPPEPPGPQAGPPMANVIPFQQPEANPGAEQGGV